MIAKDLYHEGKLTEAIKAMNDEVREHPADTHRRGFLCELLCLVGNLDRADLQLDTMSDQDPQVMAGISLIRQLIRGEQHRRQFYKDGRVPEFIGEPTEHLQLHLQASIALREGNVAGALETLVDAEAARPKCSGTWNGNAFDDLRDLDDLTASFFEVLTSTGKYFWIGTEQVVSMTFRAPSRPRDLMWRPCHMDVRDGPDGEVYLPSIYVGTDALEDERALLGRVTEWTGGDGAPVRGLGQRTFLAGEQAVPILALESIEFGDE